MRMARNDADKIRVPEPEDRIERGEKLALAF